MWRPIRSLSIVSGLCGIANSVTAFRRSRAMLAISTTCLLPLRTGRPLTTIYASPIVSTLGNKTSIYLTHTQTNKYLVNIVFADDVVTLSVQSIEQLYNLYWRDLRTYCSEADNIGEVDGDSVKNFCFNVLPCFQVISNAPKRRQNSALIQVRS